MGKSELDFIYNHNPYSKFIESYGSYRDDLSFIWSGNAKDLKEFYGFMNSRKESIKFTLCFDLEHISYLDVLVKKEGTSLHTEVYEKETNRNTFLQFSYHSSALKRSLPHNQLLRTRRICDSDESFESLNTFVTVLK